MTEITTTVVGNEEVLNLLKELPEELFLSARKTIAISTFSVHAKVSSYSGGLKNRSGRLRRSLIPVVKGDRIQTLAGSVSTNVIYAPIQEKGGVVRAKNKYVGVPGGPYLNIPLSANKTAAGVLRQNARSVFSAGGYIIKSKKGNYIVMSGENIPMFVLVKQVTIKPRLNMIKSAEDEVPTLLSNLNSILFEGL